MARPFSQQHRAFQFATRNHCQPHQQCHQFLASLPSAVATPGGRGGGACPAPAFDDTYTVQRPKDAYWAVLFRGCCVDDGKSSRSILGNGHLERASAWSHIVAALAFAMYGIVRVSFLSNGTMATQLGGVAVVMSAVTFATSSVYHVYATVPTCATAVRNLDHVAIYAGMAAAAVADLAVVTLDFRGLPFHTVADPLLAATVLATYFSLRRCIIPAAETHDTMFGNECSLGLFRIFHSDLEHAGLRIAGVGALTLMWIPMAPAAITNLEATASAVWLVGVSVATVLLVCGVLFDNMYVTDRAYTDGGSALLRRCACTSRELGCVMNSHAWWHVAAFLGAVVMVAARDYGIGTLVK